MCRFALVHLFIKGAFRTNAPFVFQQTYSVVIAALLGYSMALFSPDTGVCIKADDDMTMHHINPDDDLNNVLEQSRRRGAAPFHNFYRAPWWLLCMILIGLSVVVLIMSDSTYKLIYDQLKEGIALTIFLAVVSYAIAIIIGLLTGVVRSNPPMAPNHGAPLWMIIRRILHTILYNVITFYVEFMRGIPTLVFLLITGFIIVPALRDLINTELLPLLRGLLNDPNIPDLVWRGRDPGTAIAGLSLVYGAFLSEVFRAGIQSVDKGQLEAARSLGMSYLQMMRYIVVPQALRIVLPPLGNDFVAMIKDTSLVTILGISEITQIARRWSGSSFLYLQTYLVLSFIYLVMTTSGSVLVQQMERRLNRNRQR